MSHSKRRHGAGKPVHGTSDNGQAANPAPESQEERDARYLKEAIENPGSVPPPESKISIGSVAPVNPPKSNLNPFNVESFRLNINYGAAAAKPLLTTVPCRKPDKSAFIRVHPDAMAYSMPVLLLAVEGDKNSGYLIHQDLYPALQGDPACTPWQLVAAITRQNTVFLWKIRLPGPDGRDNQWWVSERDAVVQAREEWVRVAAKQDLGAYEVSPAKIKLPDPVWPRESMEELMLIAFKHTFIDHLDHDVLKRLDGRA
jgi:hypothetical protein